MQLSYVLIKTRPGLEHEVGQELLKLDAIDNVNILYGKYDLIAKVCAGSLIDLHESVLTQIRDIDGVAQVKTLMVNHES